MTNKEHLATLSANDWFDRIYWLYHSYGKFYTDSRAAIIHWLDEQYHSVTPITSNDLMYYYCPVCFTPFYNREPVCYKCRTNLDWESVYEKK